MEETLICSQQEELVSIAQQLLKKYPNNRIFSLDGAMGVGKTTFMKYLCLFLQCTDDVSSPTYSLVNEYDTPTLGIIYHFDFYRIKHINEAIDMGFTEYLDSGKYCFIEWAEKVEALLPPDTIHIKMSVDYTMPDKKRIFVF